MNYNYLFLSLIYFLSLQSVRAQTDIDIDQLIESIAQNNAEDLDYASLAERLYIYNNNPIDINTASREQLQELFFLSPMQINALLNRRSTMPLTHLLELQSIKGFDSETIEKLVHFVKVPKRQSNGSFAGQPFENMNHDLIIRYARFIEKPRNFTGSDISKLSAYLGCPNRLMARYKFNAGDLVSGSLVMEKDAGEQLFAKTNLAGFDFYSGNITVKNFWKIDQLIIGDYGLQFGEGLTLWSGLTFGKGSDILALAKQDIGIKSYSSVNEYSFFRGIATSSTFKKFRFSSFVSYRKLDASLQAEKITSLLTSGLHRTASEIRNKHNVAQFLVGSNLQYSKNAFTMAITAYQSRYTHSFEPRPYAYNRFNFTGKRLTNVGLNYNYSFRNTYFFGEMAHSIGSGYAFLNGLISSISPHVSLSILHRNYQKDYHSFYNQAIAETSKAVNERGVYTGLVIKPSAKWEYFMYMDWFRFPWLKFRVDAPSYGYELFSQLSYQPNKQLKFIFRYKLERKAENDHLRYAIHILESIEKQHYRFQVNNKINPDISLRSRVEFVHYQKAIQQPDIGRLIYQDVIYAPLQSKFRVNLRFAFFDTPGYDSRIYAYENDVLYSYTMQVYQNKGFRYYMNGRYTIRKGLDCWLKYSMTYYLNRHTGSLGLDQIDENRHSDIRLQLRYQF